MTSDSSLSTTPILTPDSTGTSSSSPDPSTAKKARRGAVYPNLNSSNKPQKPFSRSAAKRESVMALGSIEHLQHYFTKTGIAPKKNQLNKPFRGLVPAIGGLSHVRTTPSTSITSFTLPPSPEIPVNPRPAFPPYVKTYETDPESLLPGVVEDLSAVSRIWQLDTSQAPDLAAAPPIDVLGLLKITTRAIRSIRNYLVSLPDESAGTIRANFRPTTLGPGKAPLTTSASSSAQLDPLTLIRRSALEVLTVLRVVEENCRLPLSDEAYDRQSDGGSRGGGEHSRVASPSNNSADLPRDDESEGYGGHDFAADVSITFMHVQGRSETVPVWEDEDDDSFVVGLAEEEKEKREHWDERLDVRSGWLYRQDVTLKQLHKERKVVAGYLDVVDEVLFEWKKDETKKERGWEREKQKAMLKEDKESLRAKSRRVSALDGTLRTPSMFVGEGRRRVSTGMLNLSSGARLTEEPESMVEIQEDEEDEESADDEDLPEWAQRSSFVDDDLGRAHALLSNFLPSHLASALEFPSPRSSFLNCLSSGQLLCMAYNACVRKSKRPWGYVSKDGIHDIMALEKVEGEKAAGGGAGEGGKKVWTFRRTDNLRLWAGALKLRYLLPIQVPTQTLTQPGTNTPLGSPVKASYRPSTEAVIVFDAKVVARKDEGWEDMLEAVLLHWVRKAVDERRSAR